MTTSENATRHKRQSFFCAGPGGKKSVRARNPLCPQQWQLRWPNSWQSCPSPPGTYVACLYDGLWWVGCVPSLSEEHGDYGVTFMQPRGPSKAFQWPQREDVCWVPAEHILCKITVPTTSTGRSYSISDENRAAIQAAFLELSQQWTAAYKNVLTASRILKIISLEFSQQRFKLNRSVKWCIYLTFKNKLKAYWKDYGFYLCYSPVCALCSGTSCISVLPFPQCKNPIRS